jgi:S1-C subfamily serine protease
LKLVNCCAGLLRARILRTLLPVMLSVKRFCAALMTLVCLLSLPVSAQTANVWVQVEAQPTLAQAQTRARDFAGSFPNVAGFRMQSGWYAIALGPFTREVADIELSALKRRRLIPNDSFIAFSSQFRQQFWPVGATTLTQPATPVEPVVQPAPNTVPDAPLVPEIVVIPDETPRQARNSERLLSASERRELQEALKWEGFYTAAIDGAFGPGTRRAMAAYQGAKSYDETGVLTTKQRLELVSTYNEAFAALGLQTAQDADAGIEVLLPMGMIQRGKIEPPFVKYDSTTEDGVEVLLISQLGDQNTLFGLYDIMQTLEIVPPEGARDRGARSFTLTGQNATKHSYTFAALSGSAVKGFTIVYKPGDERVMARVVDDMRKSFTALPDAVLPDIAGDGSAQRIDLVAGLQVRRPVKSRSGFYINDAGAVLTTTDVLGQCNRLTINEETEVQITAQDDALGLAVLSPTSALAPIAFAAFQSAVPRLRSEIAVSGFSFEDVLDLPTVTYGTLEDIRGLRGEDTVQRLALDALPGDAGGPVFDQTGSVVGVLQPRDDGARALPSGVSFAVNVPAIAGFLSAAGLSARASEAQSALAPEDLTLAAADMTVLVSCWN